MIFLQKGNRRPNLSKTTLRRKERKIDVRYKGKRSRWSYKRETVTGSHQGNVMKNLTKEIKIKEHQEK